MGLARAERFAGVPIGENVEDEILSLRHAEGRIAANMRRFSDPTLLSGFISAMTGPETGPAEAFTEDAFNQIFSPS